MSKITLTGSGENIFIEADDITPVQAILNLSAATQLIAEALIKTMVNDLGFCLRSESTTKTGEFVPPETPKASETELENGDELMRAMLAGKNTRSH